MKKGNGLLGLIIIIALIWGAVSLFNDDDDFAYDDYYEAKGLDKGECYEPENPYSNGSGHYAGFEWAERNDPSYCSGNSNSFIEGCEEYQAQLEVYDYCISG